MQIWINRFHKIEDGVLGLLLLSMILIAFSQIVLRNFFDGGIVWGDPVLRLLLLWLGLMGALVATRDRNHIVVDALLRVLPDAWRRAARILTGVSTAGICALLSWHGGRMTWFDYQDGGILVANIPIWVGELIIPLAFGFMALRFLVQAFLPEPIDQ